MTVQLLRHDWTHYKEDHLAYALLPAIAYLALLVAAAMIWAENALALDFLAPPCCFCCSSISAMPGI